MPVEFLGVLLGLGASVLYGTGDFCGGIATRRIKQYQVLFLGSLVGMAVMVVLSFLWGEGIPSLHSVLWALGAGFAGLIGLALLYQGLSQGEAAVVSPVSGVVGVVLPVVFGSVFLGVPGSWQLLGFALAIPGIWLVAANSSADGGASRSGLLLGLGAGVGFGLFFILISQVDPGTKMASLAISKISSFLVTGMILLKRRERIPSLVNNPYAVLAGILDPTANVFYLAASLLYRLDVAAVLSSLYPAVTVLLSRFIFHEQVRRSQWIGIALCLAAIGLISL